MSATVRPIRLPGARALAALEALATAALATWADGWLRPGARPPVLDLRALEPVGARGAGASAGPFERHEGEGGRLWIRAAPEDRRALSSASLGPSFLGADGEPVDAWAAEAVRGAWQARDAALCAAWVGPAVLVPCDGPDDDVHLVGSGAVRLEVAAIGLFAIADAGVLRRVPPPTAALPAAPPCIALGRAAARAPVRLSVSAGRVELGLRTLLELQPGDVLRLPTRLDEPLLLRHGDAPPLPCALGEAAGRAAVRLWSTGREPA
jgi:hypothetical protein